jgi:acetyl-CoA acetyltransferase
LLKGYVPFPNVASPSGERDEKMSQLDGVSIAGLGITPMGKRSGPTPADLAADAIALALDDAGLKPHELDGLLVSSNRSPDMTPRLQMALGLEDMGLVAEMSAFGASAVVMLATAAGAIRDGVASAVALVFADTPLRRHQRGGAAYSRTAADAVGMEQVRFLMGDNSVTQRYALAARRHMELFGTSSEQLGAIAVAQRKWAEMNPMAQMRTPLTLSDHQESRFIVEPLHLFDCCILSNGAIAVVVTSADRAADLRQPPVRMLGWGFGAPGDTQRSDREPGITTGAVRSGPAALRMAGLQLADLDLVQLYDCYTYTVLVSLEDYGYCAKGEGGAFVSETDLGPGGTLALNTGGGQLSAYYMWGFTPLSEAIIQLRGQAGDRQVTPHRTALVSGNGSALNFHSTLLLGVD